MDEAVTQTNEPEDKKMIMTHKTSHLKDYIDRLYVSRKEGKRPPRIEDSVDVSIQRLEN